MLKFESFMSPGRKGHLIGIGGVSMSSLAEVLSGMGLKITGSDICENDNVVALEEKGFKVYLGHWSENIEPDTEFIVRTAAVRDDNPEIVEARSRNIPVFERTQAWGAISGGYRNALCISGTHGKTTTTSMCTHILMAADEDPTVMIGGTLPLLHSGHRVGKGNTIVMEACEYMRSFHALHPTVAVILNVEHDHADCYPTLKDVQEAFRIFAESVPEDGCIIANMDDESTMATLAGINREIITFGLTSQADVYAQNIKYIDDNSEFDIYYKGEKFTDIILHVPGIHNVKNALAATAAMISLGIRPSAVKYGLAGFTGAGRRFEFKGRYNGADVYDDYAHHPGELEALLDAVSNLHYRRTVLAFQPHTYSRTVSFFDDFVKQLSRPDVTLLAEIYAAREKNTFGISSADLAAKIPGAEFYPTFDELEEALIEKARPGDLILTVGAGDIYLVGENLVE